MFELDDVRSARMVTFSKGMRQKVLIAAALLHAPDVIIFDEPLNGLDANAMLVFKELLRGLAAQGRTILFCSHLLDIVERLCPRIVIIDKGRAIAEGTPEAIAQRTQSSDARAGLRRPDRRAQRRGRHGRRAVVAGVAARDGRPRAPAGRRPGAVARARLGLVHHRRPPAEGHRGSASRGRPPAASAVRWSRSCSTAASARRSSPCCPTCSPRAPSTSRCCWRRSASRCSWTSRASSSRPTTTCSWRRARSTAAPSSWRGSRRSSAFR